MRSRRGICRVRSLFCRAAGCRLRRRRQPGISLRWRSGCSVERVDLLPAADVHRGRRGEHQAAEQGDYESFLPGGLHYEREKRSVAEVEPECTNECAHYDHRLEPNQSPQIEVPLRHALPAVVVGISDDEARQNEKEVDGEIAVVYYLVAWAGGICLEEMENNDEHGGYASKAVENLVARF